MNVYRLCIKFSTKQQKLIKHTDTRVALMKKRFTVTSFVIEYPKGLRTMFNCYVIAFNFFLSYACTEHKTIMFNLSQCNKIEMWTNQHQFLR